MSRDQQAAAIWQAIGLHLINDQFARSVRAVLGLAALGLDADTGLVPAPLQAVEDMPPTEWPHVKGQLESAVAASGMDTRTKADWMAAFEAVYRIAGCEDVAADYGGFL